MNIQEYLELQGVIFESAGGNISIYIIFRYTGDNISIYRG